MESVDLPLLLASSVTSPGPEQYPLDRVRLQKAIFLLTQRGSERLRGLYSYRPYNWGPYSDALAEDVRTLQAFGRLKVQETPHNRYGRYITTELGEADARRVWSELTAQEQGFIAEVRRYVTASSFQKLLREIYAAYPQFATASHFRG